MRLIDADALFPYGAVPFIENDGFATADKLYGIIKNAPTIVPETLRPTGRWEKHWCDNSLIEHMYEVCPNCRSCEILYTEKFWDSNYCPNCGAKMEG